MQQSDKKRIEFILSEIKMGQQALADKLQLPVYKIKSIKSGKTKISVEIACLLEEIFNFNFKWLLTGKGEKYLNEAGQSEGASENVAEMQYMDLVKEFQDQVRAKSANLDLVKIEKIDREAFIEVVGYIKGMANNLKLAAEKQEYSRITSDRRKVKRRQQDSPDAIPDGRDRRSGQDRRKTGT